MDDIDMNNVFNDVSLNNRSLEQPSGSGVNKDISENVTQPVSSDNMDYLSPNDDLLSFRLTTRHLLPGNYDHDKELPSFLKVDEDPLQAKFYDIPKPYCSDLIDPSKLPEAFKPLQSVLDLKGSKKEKLQAFLGVDNKTFETLQQSCDPNTVPTEQAQESETNLQLHLNSENRRKMVGYQTYLRWLKYKFYMQRPVMPPPDEEREEEDSTEMPPGAELVFSIRVYIPFVSGSNHKSRQPRCSREFNLKGNQPLTDIIDNIICLNDLGLRKDVSENPEQIDPIDAKELFKSNFLFISNKFYNDMRLPQATDLSEPIRAWAQRKGIGIFEHANMADYQLKDLKIKLGHPEVYLHQGSCEHLFTFSDVQYVGNKRNVIARNFIRKSHFLGCLLCSHNPVAWVVMECIRIPYDPALICKNCFYSYLYIDGKKIGHFKAYKFDMTELKMHGLVF